MNFLNDLIKLRTIFFLILIYSFQGKPVLSNDFLFHFPLKSNSFPLPAGLFNNPITDLTFDNNGIMYVSSGNAVHIGNGIKWEKINTNDPPFLTAGTKNVYLYTNNDAGIITSDSTGQFIFNSYRNLFEEQSFTLFNVEDLAAFQGTVYLKAGSKLFLIKENIISVEDPDFEAGKIFNTKNNIIIYKPESGFRKIGINNRSEFVKHNFKPDFLLEHPEGYVAYTKDDNQFIMLSPDLMLVCDWQPEMKEKIAFVDNSDDYFFFYSEDNKLFIHSSKGKKESLTGGMVISQNEALKGMKFAGNKLWLIQHGRLSYIEYPPVFINSNFPVVSGNILSTVIFDDDIYLGSDEGLFIISSSNNVPLRLMSGICRKLINIQTTILALTDKGIYFPGNNNPTELISGYARDLVYDPVNQRIIFSMSDQIISMKICDDKALWQVKTIFAGHDPGIIHLSEPYIYFTDQGRSGRISSGDELSEPEFFPDIHGENIIKIFTFLEKPHLLTDRNIYLLNEDLSLSKVELSGIPADYFYYNATVINGNSIWINVKNPSGRYKLYYNTGGYLFTQITTPLSDDTYPYTICSDIPGRYLISSGKHFFVLNPCHRPLDELTSIYQILITKITAGKDTLFEGLGNSMNINVIQEKLDNLSYKNRFLRLRLSSTNYSQADIFYKYILQGRNVLLSENLSHPLIELKNLKTGKYSLTITSYDTFLNRSIETMMSFRILPPFYLEWWAIIAYIFISSILGFVFYKHFKIKEIRTTGLTKKNVSELVTKEMPKSELFSVSIKPAPSDRSKWDKFEIVTVLFSDIQGFTKIAEQMNPEKLIDELDIFFFHFDSVCEKYDIEKIKTIGDAYMAAGGIPRQNSTNPIEVVLVALEMQNYMKQLKTSRTDIWDLRTGIHSGPIIGGVIGYKKRSYDIWGDTVNTASRMESSGEPGKVNISEITYQLIKDFFICEYRGKLPVKYKGNIAMYFVKGLRPELSINLGSMPNRLFFLKLQSLRLKDLEEIVFERLRKELPENLHFHTFNYIKHIYDHACLLSNAESLNAEDSILIKTSALFLFYGLCTNYHNFQNKSAEITREMLPGYKYSDNQINVICNLILFSKFQHEPQNYLEKIIYDLKTEHYNRADFLKLYKLHFLEVVENSGKITIQEWKQDQIRFLKKHNFYTLSAQRLSEIPSDTQIKKIESDEWE